MPDTKITALTAIGANPIIPATFPIPMVDLTDTSMAASGTTKKVTVNQILGAGGTATLASATITGDLTVRNWFVTGGSLPGVGNGNPFAYRIGGGGLGIGAATETGTTAPIVFYAGQGGVEQYRIAPLGVNTWSDGAGGTRMTLNATGLGVGIVPSSFGRFSVQGTAGGAGILGMNTDATQCDIQSYNKPLALNRAGNNIAMCEGGGQVGIGVAPSAWGSNYKSIDLVGGGRVFTVSGTGTHGFSFNAFNNNTNWLYQFSTVASRFELQQSGNFAWLIAPSGTAGNAITFTQAMTLTAAGELLVGTTTNTNASRVFARGTGGATTLAVQSSTGDTANPGVLIGKFDNDSTTSQILVRFTINNNAAGSGQITANGANQAAFGTFSDSRLKENILNLPSQLANILSLRPVEFDYKDGSGHQIGFVAQEMQEVYSDAVGEQNGFLTVTGWSKTEARLVSAIKELAAKVQALEAKLA